MGGHPINPQRAAYLVVRAARCRRRLILSLVLLVYTAALWGYRLIPGFAYPWWYALVPTTLFVGVLALGRVAARQMKANDLAYHGGQNANARRGRNTGLGLVARETADFVAYSDDIEYEPDEFEFDDDDALPYVNDQYVNEQMHLPVPATQMIPEADLRLAIENHLKDDPELAGTMNSRVGAARAR